MGSSQASRSQQAQQGGSWSAAEVLKLGAFPKHKRKANAMSAQRKYAPKRESPKPPPFIPVPPLPQLEKIKSKQEAIWRKLIHKKRKPTDFNPYQILLVLSYCLTVKEALQIIPQFNLHLLYKKERKALKPEEYLGLFSGTTALLDCGTIKQASKGYDLLSRAGSTCLRGLAVCLDTNIDILASWKKPKGRGLLPLAVQSLILSRVDDPQKTNGIKQKQFTRMFNNLPSCQEVTSLEINFSIKIGDRSAAYLLKRLPNLRRISSEEGGVSFRAVVSQLFDFKFNYEVNIQKYRIDLNPDDCKVQRIEVHAKWIDFRYLIEMAKLSEDFKKALKVVRVVKSYSLDYLEEQESYIVDLLAITQLEVFTWTASADPISGETINKIAQTLAASPIKHLVLPPCKDKKCLSAVNDLKELKSLQSLDISSVVLSPYAEAQFIKNLIHEMPSLKEIKMFVKPRNYPLLFGLSRGSSSLESVIISNLDLQQERLQVNFKGLKYSREEEVGKQIEKLRILNLKEFLYQVYGAQKTMELL